jgi:tetratricopeptide (TPR) repeat protein
MQSYGRGQLDEAARLFQEALKTDGANTDALYNLGALAEKRGDLEQALDYYRRALSANPDDKQLQATIDEVAARAAESRAEAARARAEQEFALAASQARHAGLSVHPAAPPYASAVSAERRFSGRPATCQLPLTSGARKQGSGSGGLMRSVTGMALTVGTSYLGGSIGGALRCPMCRIIRGF